MGLPCTILAINLRCCHPPDAFLIGIYDPLFVINAWPHDTCNWTPGCSEKSSGVTQVWFNVTKVAICLFFHQLLICILSYQSTTVSCKLCSYINILSRTSPVTEKYLVYNHSDVFQCVEHIKILSYSSQTDASHTFVKIYTLLAKKVVTPPLKTIKPMWIELLCFYLAEIGMIWTCDCSLTKSDTTLGRHSMQGQVGSSSSETTV